MIDDDQKKAITKLIVTCLPEIKGIYLFGSMAKSEARPESDVDLALWLQVKPDAEQVYELKSQLSALTQRDVDLVDLQRADTVTQAQVISGSETLFARDPSELAFYETTIYSQYAQLNLERREIVEDIVKRGTIYAR